MKSFVSELRACKVHASVFTGIAGRRLEVEPLDFSERSTELEADASLAVTCVCVPDAMMTWTNSSITFESIMVSSAVPCCSTALLANRSSRMARLLTKPLSQALVALNDSGLAQKPKNT